ncbi:type VI secretion system Vgr family protein [Stenotrophomonas sp.]|uniref:type VI secretion system Vgr family protein n=1 Tax=Stenotrophomonas sp. TaxID=69392 RepID=UPI0028AA4CD2|nr:type VI secretion system Vgr family protein [Stenotrophomonas sp.]
MDKLNNLMAQIAVLGNAQRQYQLQCDAFGNNVVERWRGRDALSAHAATEVDVLATEQGADLQALLAKPAILRMRTADGGEQRRSGLIASATCLGSDGGLVRYRFSLQSWTWWLQHARHSRVFQDKTLRQIVDSVLEGYPELARWRWAEGCDEFIAARARSYCVQYRESDLAFVQRLLAEEGLGWRLCQDEQAPCGNSMEIFADSSALPQDAASASVGVRFHRSDATESSDIIQTLGRQRALGSNRISLLSDDYRSVRGISAQLPVDGGGEQSQRESYDVVGAYAFSNAAAAGWYARLQAQAHEVHACTWLGQATVRGFQSGTWIQVQQAPFSSAPELLLTELDHAGINNLPTDVRQALDDALGKPPINTADAALWLQAEKVGYANRFKATERAMPWRPALVDGTGQRLNPRPTAPGYQTARVIASHGGKGQDVHADSLGRIRVCFHFQNGEADTTWLRVAQRYAGPGVGAQFLPRIGQEVLVGFLDGDIDRPIVLGALYNGRGEAGVAPTPAGASGNDERSAYAQARDNAGSAQGNLSGGHAPAWHAAGAGDDAHRNAGAVWGIRSREWEGGQGSNHLLFDDSDQQLRVQLASSQQTSQLSLGHLRHQADNFLGSLRGTGFELRSDAWGAVRASSGAWFSAYTHRSNSPAGEAVQPAALLGQLQSLSTRFSQAARTHLTSTLVMKEGARGKERSSIVPDQAPLAAMLASARTTVAGTAFDAASGEAAQRQATAGSGRVPHSGDPLLGFAAPAGIVHVAGQALHWSVGEGLLLASGGDSDTAVMGNARLHAGQAIGMLACAVEGGAEGGNALSVVAGTGELNVQAQHDELRLQSRQALRAASAQGVVELAAGKTIHIATSGGASVTIEGGNITFNCPGTITVHASKKSFVGPAELARELPTFPVPSFAPEPMDFDFWLQDMPGPTGNPLAETSWRIIRNRGKPFGAALRDAKRVLLEGVTDADGHVVLDDDQQQLLAREYAGTPSQLWLLYPGHSVQIDVARDKGDWDEDQRLRMELGAAGFTAAVRTDMVGIRQQGEMNYARNAVERFDQGGTSAKLKDFIKR